MERETLPALLRGYREGPAGVLDCLAAEDAEEGGFLGWFSLRPAHSAGLRPGDGLELGYRLRPAVWGRGYAPRAPGSCSPRPSPTSARNGSSPRR
nr:GNAT family N-acetyltransferase [Streptomyces sp. ST2-7A]